MEVKLLDCTLRDGGYINGWRFGCKNIYTIIEALVSANIDFIELGFFKNSQVSSINSTLFDSVINGINPFYNFVKDFPMQKFSLMVNAGELSAEFLLKEKIPENVFIRISFRKDYKREALNLADKLINKNVKVFLCPMFVSTYSKENLKSLINEINCLNPYVLSLTDTSGSMLPSQVGELMLYADTLLNNQIALAFHSHNNLNMSYDIANSLLKLDLSRSLILDSCLAGMGRGAGNLSTLKIAEGFKEKYDTILLEKAEKLILNKYYSVSPWGVSEGLAVAAKNSCHPDYGIFLDSSEIKPSSYNYILSLIPEKNKYKFNRQIIEQIVIPLSKYY